MNAFSSVTRVYQLSGALLLTTLLACQKNEDPAAAGLQGRWQLTGQQCYCAPGPLPDEVMVFTDTEYFSYRESQLVDKGTFKRDNGQICGLPAPDNLLLLTSASLLLPPTAARPVINGDTLTLDYGRACDARFTIYVRVK